MLAGAKSFTRTSAARLSSSRSAASTTAGRRPPSPCLRCLLILVPLRTCRNLPRCRQRKPVRLLPCTPPMKSCIFVGPAPMHPRMGVGTAAARPQCSPRSSRKTWDRKYKRPKVFLRHSSSSSRKWSPPRRRRGKSRFSHACLFCVGVCVCPCSCQCMCMCLKNVLHISDVGTTHAGCYGNERHARWCSVSNYGSDHSAAAAYFAFCLSACVHTYTDLACCAIPIAFKGCLG